MTAEKECFTYSATGQYMFSCRSVGYLTGLGTGANRHLSLQIKVRECLLSFGAETIVFEFVIQKYKV